MKEFINNHAKLYWTIVVTVAVLAFTIVTCIGCSKLERAEAAEEMTYYKAYVKACEYVGVGVDDYSTYPYRLVHNAGSAYCTVLFNYNKFDWYDDYNYAEYPYGVSPTRFIRVYTDGTITDLTGTGNIITGFDDILWANHDVIYKGTLVHSNDGDFAPDVNYTYFINAPYLEATKVEVYNALLENQRESNIEVSEWQVHFDLKGQPMNGIAKLVAQNEYYVWLPSFDFISTKIGQYFPSDLGNGAALYNYNLSGLKYDIASWQGKVGSNRNSVLYKIQREEEYNPAYDIVERYDYKDLQDIIEYQYGYRNSDGEWVDFSLAEYYGFDDDDSGWLNIWRPIVFSYLYISRVDSQLYTYVTVSETDTDIYYGRYMIYDFVLTDTVVNTAISEDMQSENKPSDIEDVINSSRDESYKDVISDMLATKEELEQQIENTTGSLGSYDTEFDGNGLWGAIKSLGSGLLGMTGFVSSFAVVLGSFFGFLPYDVQQYVGYLMIAALLIILWRLLKGK